LSFISSLRISFLTCCLDYFNFACEVSIIKNKIFLCTLCDVRKEDVPNGLWEQALPALGWQGLFPFTDFAQGFERVESPSWIQKIAPFWIVGQSLTKSPLRKASDKTEIKYINGRKKS